jgi:hypothetical protein
VFTTSAGKARYGVYVIAWCGAAIGSAVAVTAQPPAVNQLVPQFLQGTATPYHGPTDDEYRRADSVVLEWVPSCLGAPVGRGCKGNLLTVTRDGELVYVTDRSSDSTRTIRMRVDPSRFRVIVDHARALGFYNLPDVIIRDRHFCPGFLSDMATTTVTLYLPNSSKQVIDYEGCAWAPVGLRSLEAEIARLTAS